jgi:hypothetical protein
MLDSYESPDRLAEQMGRLEENSAKTCRQAPHGVTGVFESETTTKASKSLSPSAMAAQMAALSAQIVKPNERFSTLHPMKIRPLFPRSAAPTANCEYGA